jgi:chloride channel, nucleotide-sensitive, 1A
MDDCFRVFTDVTYSKVLLYSSGASAGVAIPYRSISLHAIQTLPTPTPAPDNPEQGVYMQLLIAQEETSEDVEPESFSLTIIPTASAPPAAAAGHADPDVELETENEPEQTPVQALFNALSDCANLHPDPVEEDDEEGSSRLFQAGLAIPGDSSGGLPPPMPGSGGWITAENMHEFVDEDGNWIEQDTEDSNTDQPAEPLGPGAGSVRVREDEAADVDANGDGETKWQRTA